MSSTVAQPDRDTVELSVFGCGVGESLAVHFGQGQWLLVDSCRSNKNDEPDALKYLRSINVDLARDVKYIIATHWHDDHVDGLSQLVKACPEAQIFVSAALACDELLEVMGLYNGDTYITDKKTSGVRELGTVFQLLECRSESTRTLNRTLADHTILKSDLADIVALSPSQGSIAQSHQDMGELLKELLKTDKPRGVVPSAERNHYSIVLWIRCRETHLLLGGDLENSSSSLQGWQAVMRCQCLPNNRASIYKVAHHGSPNGDNDEIWSKLLTATDPIAAVTAYNRGKTKRPSKDDVTRILKKTSSLYVTTLPSTVVKRRDNAVERELRQFSKKRRQLTRAFGQVQIRVASTTGVPQVALFGSAKKAIES